MKNTPTSRKKNLIIQETGDEVLIYDLRTNKAVCLNEMSVMIWEMCDGKRSVQQMTQKLSEKMNNVVDEDIVWLAIDQLRKEDLLLNSKNIETPFKGLSRRKLIKRIGYSSMIALPIVASLKVPNSVHAQSCAGIASPCATGSDCCSSNCVGLPNPTSVCCVSGATFNNMAGDPRIGCSPVGDQPDCDARAAVACCSGTGSLGVAGTCAPFPGTVECVCN